MSITLKKYVDIVSGVAGAAAASERELIQRIMTTNVLVPVNSFLEITTLVEVGTYFGTDSDEYDRAIEYFGFISKSITQNDKISYAGYALAPIAARIIGNQQAQVLATLQAFTDAEITLNLGAEGGSTGAVIDLSGAADIAAAMTLIETELQGLDASAKFTGLTVAYDAVTQRVELVAGAAAENVVVFSSATEGFLAALGWGAGSAASDGSDGETLTAAMAATDSASDNFGSFDFVETLTIAQVVENATWNDGLNVKYMYCVPVSAANAQAYYDVLKNLSGVCMTVVTGADGDFAESIPAILLGSTDYNGSNSVKNYMFQIVNYPVSVDDTATSDSFDEIRANYNGQTQQAGSQIFFYQRGIMMGLSTDPVNMNTYANEMWFKDANSTSLINLMLAVEEIPANASGTMMIQGTIQGNINRALTNGVISVGKTLTDLQKASIKAITGDDDAAQQVENAGYWLNVTIVQETVGEITENNAKYVLVYSKDDVVRKIDGSQILI